jgi:hypothetical protein
MSQDSALSSGVHIEVCDSCLPAGGTTASNMLLSNNSVTLPRCLLLLLLLLLCVCSVYLHVCMCMCLHTQCAGTRELAAMGPANIVFSFSQYVFQALQVASIR